MLLRANNNPDIMQQLCRKDVKYIYPDIKESLEIMAMKIPKKSIQEIKESIKGLMFVLLYLHGSNQLIKQLAYLM